MVSGLSEVSATLPQKALRKKRSLRPVRSKIVTALRQFKPAVAAVLGRIAAGLVFLAEFVCRQARRLAPTSGSSTRTH